MFDGSKHEDIIPSTHTAHSACVLHASIEYVSLIIRDASAAIVPNTSELLPEPLTPVKTVSRRFGSSTSTFLRLFSRAPCTRMRS